MTLEEQTIKNIIRKLLKAEDYRIEVVALINASFLQQAISFFKKVIEAKISNKDITKEWYKKEFLSESLSADDIATNAGLNRKTIHNMHNSSRKEIVLDVAHHHYDELSAMIEKLTTDDDIDLKLTIKFNGVSVDLTINESLIVINALAVKRAALRGGLWSAAGKSVEKPLMKTLCKLYQVPQENYSGSSSVDDESGVEREVDFYLLGDGKQYKCEIKLMGAGNPESADGPIARGSHIFIADKLSQKNKKVLEKHSIEWVQLREPDGFKKFEDILNNLKIPHGALMKNFKQNLDKIFAEIF